MRLNTTKGPATIVSAYAPTTASTEEKDQFYGKFSATIKSVSKSEQVFILGDFNTKVGDDSTPQSAVIGSFGVEKMKKMDKGCLNFVPTIIWQ